MRLPSFIIWPLIFIGQLLAVSLLSWHLLAQIDFAYPTGYQLLGLEEHIAEFAPNNRFRKGFETTSPRDHWRLFSAITNAVQHSGEGLADIHYQLPNGTDIPLMYDAEIIHLTDVSHLINRFYSIGIVGAIIWSIFFAIAYRQKLNYPTPRHIALGFAGGIFIIASVVLSIGATRVFYWFHTKIFPDGHQWFFYYEDSLMTTLMKAPDIFAFIAALLLIVLIILWALSTVLMIRILKPSPTFSSPTVEKPNIKRKRNI